MIHKSLLEQVDELDKVVKKLRQAKPMWVTEICWNTNIHPTARRRSARPT